MPYCENCEFLFKTTPCWHGDSPLTGKLQMRSWESFKSHASNAMKAVMFHWFFPWVWENGSIAPPAKCKCGLNSSFRDS